MVYDLWYFAYLVGLKSYNIIMVRYISSVRKAYIQPSLSADPDIVPTLMYTYVYTIHVCQGLYFRMKWRWHYPLTPRGALSRHVRNACSLYDAKRSNMIEILLISYIFDRAGYCHLIKAVDCGIMFP